MGVLVVRSTGASVMREPPIYAAAIEVGSGLCSNLGGLHSLPTPSFTKFLKHLLNDRRCFFIDPLDTDNI